MDLLDPVDLELQVEFLTLTQVLGTELGSSGKAVHSLNLWAIPQIQESPSTNQVLFSVAL